jgi:hypothetical protein
MVCRQLERSRGVPLCCAEALPRLPRPGDDPGHVQQARCSPVDVPSEIAWGLSAEARHLHRHAVAASAGADLRWIGREINSEVGRISTVRTLHTASDWRLEDERRALWRVRDRHVAATTQAVDDRQSGGSAQQQKADLYEGRAQEGMLTQPSIAGFDPGPPASESDALPPQNGGGLRECRSFFLVGGCSSGCSYSFNSRWLSLWRSAIEADARGGCKGTRSRG